MHPLLTPSRKPLKLTIQLPEKTPILTGTVSHVVRVSLLRPNLKTSACGVAGGLGSHLTGSTYS